MTHEGLSDAEILGLVRRGDPLGVRALYERYFPPVWRYVASALPDEHAAQDVVSETFLAAVRGLGTTCPRGPNLGGWLFGIARNKLHDFRRRRRRDGQLEVGAARSTEPRRPEPPDAGLVDREVRCRLAAVLRALADDERLALEWKYLDELTVGQIAARMGRTEKAVEALLYRARRAARSCLGSQEEG